LIHAAQLDVIIDQLGAQRQTGVLKVRRRGFCVRLACGDLVANLAPEIEFVAQATAERIVVVVARGRRVLMSGACRDSWLLETPALAPIVGNSAARASSLCARACE
jgi:hypothetical protein